MYWTYYWMGVWMKMILQTLSLSTSSAIEECCLSCRDVIYCTRSLVDFYTIGQQTNWNVGLLLPHFTVSLPAWSLYSQKITVYYLLITYIIITIRWFAYMLFTSQRHGCSRTESTVRYRTVYIYSWQCIVYNCDHSGITTVLNLGRSQLNGKANMLGRMPSLVRG
jgi:hypothetical protein